MKDRFLVKLKNRLLWSDLSDNEIFDILFNASIFFDKKENLNYLSSKRYAESVKEITSNINKRTKVRKMYLLLSITWLVIVMVYTFVKFRDVDIVTLPSIVPISLLVSLWAISGNSYLVNVISPKIKKWAVIQVIFFIFTVMVFYFMYKGLNQSIYILMKRSLIGSLPMYFETVMNVFTGIIVFIIVYSYSIFFLKQTLAILDCFVKVWDYYIQLSFTEKRYIP